MKISSVREFRQRSPAIMREGEPVLLTRHGRLAGLFLPLGQPDQIPDDLRAGLIEKIGNAVWAKLTQQGATERSILSDFKAFRKRRRGR